MRQRFVLCVQLVSICLAACGGDVGEPSSFVVRDSGGMQIVVNHAPAWRDGEAWRIGERRLRIGVVEGDPSYQFANVTGAARLTDGTIVVADGGSQQLRFYDEAGRFLRSFGGPGGGPGEFTGLSGLGRTPADAIWAYDFSLRRLTWTDAAGRQVRTTQLDPEPPTLSPIGPLPDGTFVMKQLWGSKTGDDQPRTGLQREPTAYVRFDSLGALIDTVGTFPGRELVITIEKGRGVMSSPLFGRTSVGVIRRGALIVGDQETFEFATYAADGTYLGRTRLAHPAPSLGPDEIRDHIEFLIESSPPEKRAYMESSLESLPVPEARPAYGGFVEDDRGFLWVSEWSQYPAVPHTWTVLDPDDRWLGDLTLPESFFPRDIGPDWLLGTESDELGVEYVALYSLVKPSVGQ